MTNIGKKKNYWQFEKSYYLLAEKVGTYKGATKKWPYIWIFKFEHQQGGGYFFQTHRPLILLATHSEEKMNNCREILDSYDYSLTLMSRDLYGSGCDEWLVKPNEK